jgi:hypothetical protein
MLSRFLDCPIESGNDRYGRGRATSSFDPRIKVLLVHKAILGGVVRRWDYEEGRGGKGSPEGFPSGGGLGVSSSSSFSPSSSGSFLRSSSGLTG